MYRNPTPRPPELSVSCRVCGARSEVPDDVDFTCRACAVVQPTLRAADDVVPQDLRYVDHVERASYDALVPFMRSLGAWGNALELTVSCDGIPVVLSLSLNSGRVDGVDLQVTGTGLPDILLVRKGPAHVEARVQGVVREVQTGDKAFDAAVFVDSPFEEAAVLAVLGAPAVRGAIRRLLGLSHRVQVSGGDVSMHVEKSGHTFAPETLRTCVGLLRVVAGAPRRLVVHRTPVPRAARIARAISLTLPPVGLGVAVLAGRAWGPVAKTPWIFGALLGVVVATAVHPLLRRAMSGRSRSFREVTLARITGLVGLPLLLAGLLVAANGALDRSPEREVVFRIEGMSRDDDTPSLFHLRTRDPEGGVHHFAFHNVQRGLLEGWSVAAGFRSGALGWAWRCSDARLVPSAAAP